MNSSIKSSNAIIYGSNSNGSYSNLNKKISSEMCSSYCDSSSIYGNSNCKIVISVVVIVVVVLVVIISSNSNK